MNDTIWRVIYMRPKASREYVAPCASLAAALAHARHLAVHFMLYIVRIEGPAEALMNRAAVLVWVGENPDPSAPPS